MTDVGRVAFSAPSGTPEFSRCLVCAARTHNACGAVDQSILPAFAALAHIQALRPGDTLFHEGASATSIYQVTFGTVRLTRNLRNGRRQVMGFKSLGDLILAPDGETFACNAEAVTPARVCRFDRKGFARFCGEYPALSRKLLQLSASDLAESQEQVAALTQAAATNRVAAFLLIVAHAAARHGQPDNPVELPMRRADIADYLGLAVETVSRCFTRLKDLGLIDLCSAQSVRVLDFAALRDFNEQD